MKIGTIIAIAATALVVGACNKSTNATSNNTGALGANDVVGGVSQKSKEAIALCSGGFTSALDASLQAKVGKSLKEGASLDAGVKQELVGAFVNKMHVSEENAVKFSAQYIDCVNKQLGR